MPGIFVNLTEENLQNEYESDDDSAGPVSRVIDKHGKPY